ncbi:MAG: hypothetical protein JW995_05655 [Melioribacteraceae bacterium]|nr:hypothetical protein [Melioribacteraceae bacterium]
MKKGLTKILWHCTLIAVFSILVNNTVFIHTHILPDGRIIQHAHPFNFSGEKSGSQPHHKHTSKEFLLLSYVYELFSNSIIYFIAIVFLLRRISEHSHSGVVKLFPFGIKRVKTPRASPQLLLSQNYGSLKIGLFNLFSRRNSNEKNICVFINIAFC